MFQLTVMMQTTVNNMERLSAQENLRATLRTGAQQCAVYVQVEDILYVIICMANKDMDILYPLLCFRDLMCKLHLNKQTLCKPNCFAFS